METYQERQHLETWLLRAALFSLLPSTPRSRMGSWGVCSLPQAEVQCPGGLLKLDTTTPPQTPGLLHFTAFRTRLSSGLRLGSLVDERMPVPQLLANVFLVEGWEGGRVRPARGGVSLSEGPPGRKATGLSRGLGWGEGPAAPQGKGLLWPSHEWGEYGSSLPWGWRGPQPSRECQEPGPPQSQTVFGGLLLEPRWPQG